MKKGNFEKKFKKLKRSLSDDVIFWQRVFLNEHYITNRFDEFEESFMDHILNYKDLNQKLTKISFEIETQQLADDIFQGVYFTKYRMEISKKQLSILENDVQATYNQELINDTVEFMVSISKASLDVKGKGVKNLFSIVMKYSELLLKAHTEESAGGNPEPKINKIPFPSKILLFTCLSKCKAWPRLMKTQKSKKAKTSKIMFLINWFKNFAQEYKIYITSYQDIFLLNNKEIKQLRKRIWKIQEINENPYSEIFDLAWEGKVEGVKKLLLKGLDVNSKNGKKGNTALLHIAAERDDLDLASMLETFKADPNVKDQIGMTPIFYAVEHKNHDMIKKLIQMGADVNASDKFESSVFYCAIYSSDVESLEILKENGARMDTMNKIRRTPLIKAAYLDKPEAVEWLLQHDIVKQNIGHRDNRGRAAIHAACWGPRGGREGKKNGGKIIFDSPRSLELLLDAGADPKLQDHDGKTALNISISTAGMATTKVWLKRGFDFFEIFGERGKNNVFVACQFGHVDMLEFLKNEVGMPLYYIKTDKESTLQYCLRRANFRCYNYLMEYYLENDIFSGKKYLVRCTIRQMTRARKIYLGLN